MTTAITRRAVSGKTPPAETSAPRVAAPSAMLTPLLGYLPRRHAGENQEANVGQIVATDHVRAPGRRLALAHQADRAIGAVEAGLDSVVDHQHAPTLALQAANPAHQAFTVGDGVVGGKP